MDFSTSSTNRPRRIRSRFSFLSPRHLQREACDGFWTAKEDVEPRLFVLVSYAAGEEPGEVARRYMQSTEFADDIRNFNVSDIVCVESTILIPSTNSPLK